MATRVIVPKAIAGAVLIRSRRRCCLCRFWDNDNSQKEGQIAHIDRDNTNADEDNLAYLCLKHHNQYDSKQIQGKNVVPDEVRHARDELYRSFNDDRRPRVLLALEIDGEYSDFSEDDKAYVFQFIKDVLGRGSDVRITRKQPGSILLTLDLEDDDARRLMDAFDKGRLEEINAKDIRVEGIIDATRATSGQAPPPQTRTQVEVDDSSAISTYANFCRVTGTPEELIIDVGLNSQPVGPQTQPIRVNQRLILNYYTAKRLLAALQMSIQRHEVAFGVLETDVQRRVGDIALSAGIRGHGG